MRRVCSKLASSFLFLQLIISTSSSVSEDSESFESTGNARHRFSRDKDKPNIVIILADDLGWNDLSFHGSNQIPTPNIDALAYNGIILNSHYVSALCTPSRAALMTGKYPIHLGMQHSVLLSSEPRGLPLKEKLLPEYMREAGYKTHAIGKWHLGFVKREYTPTYRGFDTHFGYFNGLQDYYNHDAAMNSNYEYLNNTLLRGFDMRRNMSVAYDTRGKYSTDLFTEEAVRIISEHDKESPLFMYLSHLAVHSGNDYDPLQAPDDEIAKFTYIEDPERRIYAAMLSKLDTGVGEVVSALRQRGMLENSIILFMADNGAPTMGIFANEGSNHPLRGIKNSPWEGAVRGSAAIYSPMIKRPNRVSNQLMSIVDWLPTLWSAAGMDPNELGRIDGVNAWPSLITNRASPRSEVLINIDDIDNYAAIRRGDFKYVIGHTETGDGWYGASGDEITEFPGKDSYPDAVLNSKAGVVFSGSVTGRQVRDARSRRTQSALNRTRNHNAKMITAEDILLLRSQATLNCNVEQDSEVACDPVASPCLFNIKDDPCERVNLADKRPFILRTLEDSLLKYRATTLPPANVFDDPTADPKRWNNVWVTWRDADPWATDDMGDDFTSNLSGPTIHVIAVLLGLSFVAIITLFAIKHAKRTNLQPKNRRRRHEPHETELGILSTVDRDEPTSVDKLTSGDEQQTLKISTKMQTLHSTKDRKSSVE